MCHHIAWYHAICQHVNRAMSISIYCTTAITTGQTWCNKSEIVQIPMFGRCGECVGLSSSSSFSSSSFNCRARRDSVASLESERDEYGYLWDRPAKRTPAMINETYDGYCGVGRDHSQRQVEAYLGFVERDFL